jgi:hypothetical protein
VKAGRSAYFATLADVVSSLAKAERERIRFLCRPQLLIIDEIGYLPVIAGGGNLVFQLVLHRYPYCFPPSRSPPTAHGGAMLLLAGRSFRCHSHWSRPRGVRKAM